MLDNLQTYIILFTFTFYSIGFVKEQGSNCLFMSKGKLKESYILYLTVTKTSSYSYSITKQKAFVQHNQIIIYYNKDSSYQWIWSNVDYKTGITTTWNQSTKGFYVKKMKFLSSFFYSFLISAGNGIPIKKVSKKIEIVNLSLSNYILLFALVTKINLQIWM